MAVSFALDEDPDWQNAGYLAAFPLGVLVAGFVVSACIETIQSFMPNRTGDFVDVLMNGTGALLGAACAFWMHRVLRKRRERRA